MTTELEQRLKNAAAELAEAGVPTPRVDAELLASHVLNLSRGEVQVKAMVGLELDHGSVGEFQRLIEERARRVPLQHLTGSAPFRTLELRVGPGVFVPRPETEAVVDVALAEIDRLLGLGVAVPRIVDLGTGAGTIAASIAAERPQCDVHAIEVSEAAAAWAALNFSRLPQHAAQVRLHVQDLRDFEQDGFDVVVSNPPYIPPSMVPTEPEVHEHDPRTALYGGGEDGLEMPREVIAAAQRVLTRDGWFILEHAEVQAEALLDICAAEPDLGDVRTHHDLTGRPRATSARRRSERAHSGKPEGVEEYRA